MADTPTDMMLVRWALGVDEMLRLLEYRLNNLNVCMYGVVFCVGLHLIIHFIALTVFDVNAPPSGEKKNVTDQKTCTKCVNDTTNKTVP